MIKSIKDNVCNRESQLLFKAIQLQDNDLNGEIEIHENGTSGWIYAVDEDYNCWLFNDEDCQKIEKFISCPECGEEHFTSEFLTSENKEKSFFSISSCCMKHFKELE